MRLICLISGHSYRRDGRRGFFVENGKIQLRCRWCGQIKQERAQGCDRCGAAIIKPEDSMLKGTFSVKLVDGRVLCDNCVRDVLVEANRRGIIFAKEVPAQ